MLNKVQYTHVIKALLEGDTAELPAALFSNHSPRNDPNNIKELMQEIGKSRDLFRDLNRKASYGFLVLSEVQAYLKTVMSDGYKEIKASFATLAGLVGDGRSKETCVKLGSRVKFVVLFFNGERLTKRLVGYSSVLNCRHFADASNA